MFKAITTVAALVIATSAMAQDDLTISSLAKGETTKAAFNQMVQGHKLPAWVMKGGTYTPAQTVTLGDETYQVMSACKPHDCGSQRIAVMWSEKSNQMTGLFSTIDEKTSQVKWFTEFGHLNRGDMLTSEQHRCHNEKKKFQRRV